MFDIRKAPTLLLLLATLAWPSSEVHAVTQCINQNAPNPIEVCVTDQGRPSVYVQQPNGRQYQYYGQQAWGSVIWLNGTNTASRYTTGYVGGTTLVTPVSNTLTGAGTASNPYVITTVVDLGTAGTASGVRMTQTFTYVNGDRTLRKRFALQNNGSTTFNDLRFFHGGDTYFGGSDSARSWYDSENKMVYVTNSTFSNTGLMGFYANPATPSARYFGGQYSLGNNQAITTAQLANTADSTFLDAGYYLQWNRASLAPGATWTIDSFETWSAPGALQVIAPANDAVYPGTTVSRTFKVHNLTSGQLSINLSSAATPNGWTVSLPGGSSIVANGLQVVDVPVQITVPAGATPGTFEDVELTATSSSYTGTAVSRLSILQADYVLAPNALNFGNVAVGSTADLSVTLTNNAGGAPVTMGTVAAVNGLAAPFSILSDSCSDTTVAAGFSCVITVRYAPTANSASNDTFSFPILSPSITAQTISVEGNNGAPSSYTVSATSGANGSISPGIATVATGNTTSFIVTPASGYSIAGVTGCAGSLSGNTYTTGAINAACTVNATFSVSSFTVSAAAGSGGTISPGSASVTAGNTTSFTVTPASGYSIAGVTGCAGSLSGNTYTTGAVLGACTVSATFSLYTHVVTASAGAGGTMSPASAVVGYGGSTTFTLTPDVGYGIASVAGCGGTLSGNSYTTGMITGACSITATFALAPPTFSPAAPATYEMNATGLMTALPASLAPTAIDLTGAPLAVTLEGGATHFPPGAHTLTWRAVDSRGVTATVQQTLHVWPLVSMGKDVALGFIAGNSSSFRIALNGPAPVYPLAVNYRVSGHLQGHDLTDGTAQFVNGEVEKEIFLAVTQTAAPGTPDQVVTVGIDGAVNPSERATLAINLITGNAAPAVSVIGRQGGQTPPIFSRNGGPITLSALISDPNSADGHAIVWTAPFGAAISVVNGMLTLQADSLPEGRHRFEVRATDDGSPAATTLATFEVVLLDAAATLPAGATAWTAAGLPDHPDFAPDTPNVLPERRGELQWYVVEGDPGVQMVLGTLAMQQRLDQAELLSTSNLGLTVDTVQNVGGIFDFAIHGLQRVGQSVSVVVPQRAPIPANAIYRKFNTDTRRWSNFVEDSANGLASAPGAPGLCPPVQSSSYRPGLNAGDLCVRLTMNDGGPNDADSQANGAIVDPGGVGTLATVVVNSQGKGGSGSFDPWTLLVGALLMLLRASAARIRVRTLLVAGLLGGTLWSGVAASQEPGARWYVGGQAGPAEGDIGAAEVNRSLSDLGYNATASFNDLSRTAWRLFTGYQFLRFASVQLGYADLGTVDGRYTGNVVEIRQFLGSVNAVHPHSANGFDLSVVGRYPLTGKLSLTGRAGLFFSESTYQASNQGGETERLQADSTDLVFGGGLEFEVFNSWHLTAEWNRFKVGGERIDLAGFGVLLRLR